MFAVCKPLEQHLVRALTASARRTIYARNEWTSAVASLSRTNNGPERVRQSCNIYAVLRGLGNGKQALVTLQDDA